MTNNSNVARQIHYQRGKQDMTPTHERLLTVLLSKGNSFVAEICDVAESEASRKIQGENGFKLRQLADLFDAFGIQIAGPDDVVISKRKYQSLVLLSTERLTEESQTLEGTERRVSLSVVDGER